MRSAAKPVTAPDTAPPDGDGRDPEGDGDIGVRGRPREAGLLPEVPGRDFGPLDQGGRRVRFSGRAVPDSIHHQVQEWPVAPDLFLPLNRLPHGFFEGACNDLEALWAL